MFIRRPVSKYINFYICAHQDKGFFEKQNDRKG